MPPACFAGTVAKIGETCITHYSHESQCDNRPPVNYVTKMQNVSTSMSSEKTAREGNLTKSQCQQQGDAPAVTAAWQVLGRTLGLWAAATQVQVPLLPCGWCKHKNDVRSAGEGKPERSGNIDVPVQALVQVK